MTRDYDEHAVDYMNSVDFDDDAIDCLAMSEDRPPAILSAIRRWYNSTTRFADVIADAADGERSWR
jgi:hypothetical protein